ncbi:hypothetical protein GCM10011609_06080 [Lentzea pudingi]|uniref:4-hydroxybenzoate polyprenyltransferase n=1 Tax=Lentzea pudingi TaxID=1789439 RepID=A0ABQ2HBQ8_9PSEU|nr:UbiA family prenyltransferase [Lentzea pudingi]GGM73009.1 hypothetical protein GCM10011609_06080 [Lentzea pudingi]
MSGTAVHRGKSLRVLNGLAQASHPLPSLAVTAVAVLLGLGNGLDGPRTVLLGFAVLTGQLSIGWSNDWIDAARDRATRRADKPAATGSIAVRAVAVAAGAAALATVVSSLLLGWFAGTVLLLSVAGGWAYNLGLKATVFSGAAYLFSFAALTIGVHAAGPGESWPPWWVPVAGALLGFGAHFANVLPDLRADAETGVRGLPHRLGPRVGVIVMTLALATASVVLGLAPAQASALYSAVAVTTGLALATATTVAAIRAPHSAIAFRLTVAIALLDVVLLITITV